MMNKNNSNNLKDVLSNNKKYLDDILVLNCKEFIDISKNMYPSELTLDPSHGTGLEDHFLDLNINISDNDKLGFETEDFDFEVINFSFPESNIHSNSTYSAFYLQLLRYATIYSNYIDFKNRCKILSQKLILRGFYANKLTWQSTSIEQIYSENILIIVLY